MRVTVLAVFALTLSACAPPQAETSDVAPVQEARTGCSAVTSRDWSAVGSAYYVIEAEAAGYTCSEAVATMRIRSRDGDVLFEHAYPVADVPLAFQPNGGQTTLRADLEAWTQNTAEPPTTEFLPDWPARAERPPYFQPAVNRTRYVNARGAQGPLFCFPDGGESNACVALDGARATLLGSRTPERE